MRMGGLKPHPNPVYEALMNEIDAQSISLTAQADAASDLADFGAVGIVIAAALIMGIGFHRHGRLRQRAAFEAVERELVKASEVRFREQALTDSLTGLGNRRRLVRDRDRRFANGPAGLLAIADLDGFQGLQRRLRPWCG